MARFLASKLALRHPVLRFELTSRDISGSPRINMRLQLILAGLLGCLISNVAATALTYKLDANEKACFYATTKKEAEKIAFYFAVSMPRSSRTTVAVWS